MGIQFFLINLDRDEDRLRFMDDQLSALGIEYTRFPAIRGDSLPEWLTPYFSGAQLSAGEIGCYASHLTLMKRVLDTNKTAVILEDDLKIAPDFPEVLNQIAATSELWDIIRLSSTSRRRQISCRRLSGPYELVRYLRVPVRTGAYIIRPQGAQKFIDWKIARTRPVDLDLVRVWDHRLVTLGISPLPVTQNVWPSTIDEIGGRNKKKKFDSVIGKRRDDIRRFLYNVASIGPRAVTTWSAHSEMR